jgi:hypothetical protein
MPCLNILLKLITRLNSTSTTVYLDVYFKDLKSKIGPVKSIGLIFNLYKCLDNDKSMMTYFINNVEKLALKSNFYMNLKLCGLYFTYYVNMFLNCSRVCKAKVETKIIRDPGLGMNLI